MQEIHVCAHETRGVRHVLVGSSQGLQRQHLASSMQVLILNPDVNTQMRNTTVCTPSAARSAPAPTLTPTSPVSPAMAYGNITKSSTNQKMNGGC
jgi:hypothetical protein